MTIVKTQTPTWGTRLRKGMIPCLLPALLAATCGTAHAEPATVRPVITAPDAPDSATGTLDFSYQWLAGSTFHPVSTPGSFAYSGAGCIHPTAGSAPLFHHKLLLPAGSLVKYLRMYYRNTSTAGVPHALFTTYDMNGGFNQVPSVTGTNTGGYSYIVSDEMNYTVDHFVEPINIAVNLGTVTDGSVQFCGVRVAYYAPLPPEIFADGFED